MSVITYTATQKIISGHSSGVQYSMEVKARALDNTLSYVRNTQESLGGAVQTLFHREVERWSLTIGSFARTGGEGTMEQVNEFLASVRAGEIFQFDAYGTIATPDNVQSVVLETAQVAPQRVAVTRFVVPLVLRVVA